MTLNFVNAEIEAVARTVATLSGANVVVDPRVKGTMSLSSTTPVRAAQALRLFSAQLRTQGYALVENAGIHTVVPEADAKLQSGPVNAGNAPAAGGQVLTQIFRLNHENANNLVPVLRPLISPNNTINVTPGTNSLVITDYADNLQRLGLIGQVELLQTDVFPPGQAALVVCNPPWLPARPTSVLEQAVYDEGSQMLKGFLAGLAEHLCAGGEGWLILSDLAEHLGLRTRAELLGWIEAAGLKVLGREDTRPRHAKAQDSSDPLHAARSAEVTSLWRLGV